MHTAWRIVRFVGLLSACACARKDAPAPSSSAPLPSVAPQSPRPQAAQAAAPVERPDAGDPCAGPGDASKKDDLTCADRRAWRKKLGWSDDCEGNYDGAGMEFHRLDDGRWLVGVLCSLGAYQGHSVFYFWDEATDGAPPRATRIKFPVPNNGPGPSVIDAEEISNFADFDPKTRELKVWTRYRGPGDCGSLVRYSFDGGRVHVREMRHQPECNGKETRPERWPVVSPSKRR